MPDTFQPTATPELDARSLRKRDGRLSSVAVGKDGANDPSRTPFKVALSLGRQGPIELDCNRGEVGAAHVLIDLAVDVGVEGSLPKLD
jgi:hypothetical protein